MPECHTDGCVRDPENKLDIPCAECPLIGDEYRAWIDAINDPLYRAANRWLLDHELGLARFWDEPDYRIVEAIRFVYGERNRLEEQLRKHREGDE